MDKHLIIKSGDVVAHVKKNLEGEVIDLNLVLVVSDPMEWGKDYVVGVAGFSSYVSLRHLQPITDDTIWEKYGNTSMLEMVNNHIKATADKIITKLSLFNQADVLQHLINNMQFNRAIVIKELEAQIL